MTVTRDAGTANAGASGVPLLIDGKQASREPLLSQFEEAAQAAGMVARRRPARSGPSCRFGRQFARVSEKGDKRRSDTREERRSV
jgi:hypothetical protein